MAAALSYQTIFGLVPLLIIVVLVFAWISSVSDLGFSVKQLLYKQAFFNAPYPHPEQPEIKFTVADKIDEIVTNALQSMNTGSITIIGSIFVIVAALALLITIEMAFNSIWNVPHGRNIVQRIVNYWAMLTLGPLLIGAGIYASTLYGAEIKASFLSYVGPVLPYLITTVAFFCLYFLIPNTKVRIGPALWGAAAAALLWTIVKAVFGLYVTKFIPYKAIYGLLGLVPLTVFWIYLSWLIVLFGLQLTYTTQNIRSIEDAENLTLQSAQSYFIANDLTVLNIMRYIWQEFANNRAPVSIETICGNFGLPSQFAEMILGHLVTYGLLVRTAEPSIGYEPATDAANVRLADISAAAAQSAYAQKIDGNNNLAEFLRQQKQILERYNLKQIS